jgi:hypothetical protein
MAQQQQQQQQQTGKPLPQLDQNSTKELNLTVLQRMDRHVEDILTTAAHVTFYQFSVEDSQWVRELHFLSSSSSLPPSLCWFFLVFLLLGLCFCGFGRFSFVVKFLWCKWRKCA